MSVDQALVDAAVRLLNARFPGRGGIAAAMYTDRGTLLTGVNFEPDWGGGGFCAETGPIAEATKLGERVVASACVSRLGGDAPILVLAPCGICQERLFHFGPEVTVAVHDASRPAGWSARTLREVQPYHWVNPFR